MEARQLMWSVMALGALTLTVAAGCGSGDSGTASGPADMDELARMLDRPQQAAPVEAEAQFDDPPVEQHAEEASGRRPVNTGVGGLALDQPTAEAPPRQPPSESRTVAGAATVGSGQSYYGAIAGARRHIMSRADEWPWIQAVQHFQAEHGRLPRDHEEFMTRIVEFHGIDLGYKEEDEEFVYDPSEGRWGTVYVVKKDEASP